MGWVENQKKYMWRVVGTLWALSIACPTAGQAQNWLDVAVAANVNSFAENYSAAWGDYDGDGFPDLYIARSTGGSNLLLRNRNGVGNIAFEDVTTAAQVGGNGGISWGVNWGDYDNDGDLDLFVTGTGTSPFYNNAAGVFTARDNDGLFAANDDGGAALADYDNDGLLDYYIANDTGKLFRQTAANTFVEETATAFALTVAPTGTNSETVSWGDYDNDGDLDLYATFSGSNNLLYRNNADGRFTLQAGAVPSGVSSTSAVWGDYDNDGDQDLYTASVATLFRNEAGTGFTSLTNLAQGYASAWGDYDNDGDLDLFVARQETTINDQALRNDGNDTFTPDTFWASMQSHSNRGAAWVDYDNDEDLDLFIIGNANNGGFANKLLQNPGNTNNALTIRLEGDTSNKSGIGARITVFASGNIYYREVSVGGSWGSSQAPLLTHIGINSATQADSVRVEWPSGVVQVVTNVPSGVITPIAEPQNMAPVLDAASSLTAIDEDPTTNDGDLVSALVSITDSDGPAEGIAVTNANHAGGTWQYSLDAGNSWIAFVTPSQTAARLLPADARVRFDPAAHYNGTVNPGLTLRAWDQVAGGPGGTVDLTQTGTGNFTSFSDNELTVTITVHSVNDAPNFTKGVDPAVDEDSGPASINWTNDATPGPADESGQNLTFTILSNNNPGLFSTPPSLNASGTLTFTPTAETSGSATLTVRLDDDGGTANGGQDSSPVESLTITVNSVNDAPTLDNTGAMALDPITEDDIGNTGNTVANLIASAGGDRITDDDVGDPEGIAVTNVDNSNGTWQYQIGGGAWTAFSGVLPTNATLLAASDRVRLIPSTGFSGTISAGLTFQAWDQSNTLTDATQNGGITAFSTAEETARIIVNSVNDAPTLSGAVTLSSLAEDPATNPGDNIGTAVGPVFSDDDGDPTGIAVVNADNANGTWEYSTNGGTTWTAFGNPSESAARLLDASTWVRFSPGLHFNGTVNTGLTFRAWDQTTGGSGGTANITQTGNSAAFSASTQTASILVNPINDLPTLALNNGLQVAEGAQDIAVRGDALHVDDPDDAASALTLTLTAVPANGTLALNGAPLAIGGTFTQADLNSNAAVTYSHDGSENHVDSFTFTAADDEGASLPGPETFAIAVTAVNDLPIAVDDGPYTTPEDTDLTLSAATLLTNDNDVDNPTLTITAVSNGVRGTPGLSGTTITFTPEADFNGTGQASFDYTVSDGQGGTDTATVTVDITPVNDAPTLNSIADVALDEDAVPAAVSLTGIGPGASNETETLAVSATTDNPGLVTNIAVNYTSPNATGTLTYDLIADQFGNANITVEITDGTIPVPVAFAVSIDPIADTPTVTPTTTVTAEDQTATGIVLGRNAVDGAEVTHFQIANIAGISGTIYKNDGTTPINDGDFISYADGQAGLQFAPAQDANGTTTFDVRASLSANAADLSAGAATATVQITPVNDPPTVAANAATVAEGATDTLKSAHWRVEDVDNTPPELALSLDSVPAHGTLRRDGVDLGVGDTFTQADIDAGLLTYAHDGSETATDVISFSATDGTDSINAVFNIAIAPVNDPPVINVTTYTTDTPEDVSIDIDVRPLAYDPDGDPLSVIDINGNPEGDTSINPDSTINFSPDPDFFGTTSFSYVISDGQGGTATGSIEIDVTPVNDAPVAVAIDAATSEIDPISITLQGTDTDGDALTFRIVTLPAIGQLDTTNLPQVTYTPVFGIEDTTYTFTYIANDGALDSAPAAISITVLDAGPIITTYAGTGDPGYNGDGIPANQAQLHTPHSVDLDPLGNLYIADSFNFAIRQVAPDGSHLITTVVGTPGIQGFSLDPDAIGANIAKFKEPVGIFARDNGDLYIADIDLHAVRWYKAASQKVWTVAGTGAPGRDPDGFPATSSSLNKPDDVFVGPTTLWIADEGNGRVANTGNNLNTVADKSDGLTVPAGIFVTDDNIVYIADRLRNQIFRMDANVSGPPVPIAGTGTAGFSGDDGPAIDAQLDSPQSVFVDTYGNIYIADSHNQRIRMIDTNGIINTVVGSGPVGETNGDFAGDGNIALLARLDHPVSVVLDDDGNMYIADAHNHRIRKVSGFLPANRPPVLADLADAFVDEGQTLAIALTATDPDGVAPDFSVFGLPPFATFADNGDGSATLALAPTASQAGVYAIAITATDGADPSLSDSQTFTLTVEDVNQPPILTAPTATTLQEGTTLSIPISASDPDGTPLVLSMDNLPAFASFIDHGDNTGTLTLTPGFTDVGNYTGMAFYADDGAANAFQFYSITVNDVPPDLNLAGVQGFKGGKSPVALAMPVADRLAGATLDISYDPAQVSLDASDVQRTALTAGFSLDVDIDPVLGTVTIGLSSPTPLASGSGGDLLELSFQVANTVAVNEGDILPLYLAAADLLIADGLGNYNAIDPNRSDGQITVVAGLAGDVNLSGDLDLEDIVLILQFLAGLDPGFTPLQQALADYNQDGQTDVGDALQLLGTLAPAKVVQSRINGDAVTLDLPSVHARPGDALSVPVRFRAADPIHAIDLVLRYAPDALDLDEVHLPGDALLIANTHTPGRIRLIGVSQHGLGSFDDVLAEFSFTARSAGVHALRPDRTRLLDADAQDLPVLFAGQIVGGQALPENFAVYPNYPNPFNPETTLRYELAAGGEVEVTVYHILGQPVAHLLRRHQRAGRHELTWRADGHAPGIYLAVIRTGGRSKVIKMALIK